MWNFPEVVAPPVVRQRFRIDWSMDMGTVENGHQFLWKNSLYER